MKTIITLAACLLIAGCPTTPEETEAIAAIVNELIETQAKEDIVTANPDTPFEVFQLNNAKRKVKFDILEVFADRVLPSPVTETTGGTNGGTRP